MQPTWELVNERPIFGLFRHGVECASNDCPGEGGDVSGRVAFPVRFANCYDVQGHLVPLVAVLEVDRGRTTVGAW